MKKCPKLSSQSSPLSAHAETNSRPCKANPPSERMSPKPFKPTCASSFSCLVFPLFSLWTRYPVWFALGSGPLESGPWENRGLPSRFPVFPGAARRSHLPWEPASPRGAAKRAERPRRGLGRHRLVEQPFGQFLRNHLKGPRWLPGSVTSLRRLRKQFPGAPSTAPFESSHPTTCSGPTVHSHPTQTSTTRMCAHVCTHARMRTHVCTGARIHARARAQSHTHASPLGLCLEA